MSTKTIYHIPAKAFSILHDYVSGSLHCSYAELTFTNSIFATLQLTGDITDTKGIHSKLSGLLDACKIPHIRERHSYKMGNALFDRYLVRYGDSATPEEIIDNKSACDIPVLEPIKTTPTPWQEFSLQLLDRQDRPPIKELQNLASADSVRTHILEGQLQKLIQASSISQARSIIDLITVAKFVHDDPGEIRSLDEHKPSLGWGTQLLLYATNHLSDLSGDSFNSVISALWQESPVEKFHLQLLDELETSEAKNHYWNSRIITAMNTLRVMPSDDDGLKRLHALIASHSPKAHEEFMSRINAKRLTIRASDSIVQHDVSDSPKTIAL